MLLLDLPSELLREIFSFTHQHDRFSLSSCSRHVYTTVLPCLYSEICFTISLSPARKVLGNYNLLDNFTTGLNNFPERKSWITTADFTWYRGRESIRKKMFAVLELLPCLQTIKMTEAVYSDVPEQPDLSPTENNLFSSPSGVSQLLCRIPSSKMLKTLVLVDERTTRTDFERLLSLPVLHTLTLLNPKDMDIVAPELEGNSSREPHARSQVKTLIFLNAPPPGPEWATNLSCYLQQPLQYLTWEIYTKDFIRGSEIGMCLSHFRQNLVELHLTRAVVNGAMLGPNGPPIDLAEFSSLKILEISNHILFACPQWNTIQLRERRDWTSFHTLDLELSNRLPLCLKSLHIWFEDREYAFKPWSLGEKDYAWFKALAEQNHLRSSNLAKVKITEKRSPAQTIEMYEWISILDVQAAFDDAGIEIEIWLREL